MLKQIENAIVALERKHSFDPAWYSIVFNPFFITRRALMKEVRAFAETVGADKKILDVGCGIKPYRDLFKTHDYIGIEVSGGGHSDEAKSADHFFDGQNIPFPDNDFDVIICSEVLEHTLDPEYLLKEMRRVLRPDGTLFLTMPFVWPEHETPYDFQRFTSFKHARLLKKNDFKNIVIKQTTGVFGTCGQILSDFFISFLTQSISTMSSAGLGHKIKFALHRMVIFVFCFPVQLLFLILDNLFKKQGITLDYIIEATAQK